MAKPRTDPRKGKPSASTMDRLSVCPGSWSLTASLRKDGKIPEEQPDTKWSRYGTEIHEAVSDVLTGKGTVSAKISSDPEAMRMVERLLGGVASVVECVKADVDCYTKSFGSPKKVASYLTDGWLVTSERRLWGKTINGNEYSGQYDVGIINESTGKGIIIDFKTGYGAVAPAKHNLQLAALALLAHQTFGLNKIAVAILQPATVGTSIAVYSETQMRFLQEAVDHVIDRAYNPASISDLHASPPACKYCPARPLCPKIHEVFMRVAKANLEPNLMSQMDYAETAEMVIEDIRARVRAALEQDPSAVPGWEISKPTESKTIVKPEVAFDVMEGVVKERIWDTVKISLPKLIDITAKSIRLTKSAAKCLIEDKIGETIATTVRAGKLQRDKTTDPMMLLGIGLAATDTDTETEDNKTE